MDYPTQYLLFIEYFNEGNFFPAQKALDEVWVREEGPDREFYGGLIRLAVALGELTSGHAQDAEMNFSKAKGMLSPFGNEHKGIRLGKLIDDLRILFTQQVKISQKIRELLSSDQSQANKSKADYLNLIPQIERVED